MEVDRRATKHDKIRIGDEDLGEPAAVLAVKTRGEREVEHDVMPEADRLRESHQPPVVDLFEDAAGHHLLHRRQVHAACGARNDLQGSPGGHLLDQMLRRLTARVAARTIVHPHPPVHRQDLHLRVHRRELRDRYRPDEIRHEGEVERVRQKVPYLFVAGRHQRGE